MPYPEETRLIANCDLAVLGLAIDLPFRPAARRHPRNRLGLFRGLRRSCARIYARGVWLAILGISWFFAVVR